MKRFDLDGGADERAFVYGEKAHVESPITPDALKYLRDQLGPGVHIIRRMLEDKVYGPSVEGMYIAFRPDGRVLTTLTTATDIKAVLVMMEFVLEKLKEADKREAN